MWKHIFMFQFKPYLFIYLLIINEVIIIIVFLTHAASVIPDSSGEIGKAGWLGQQQPLRCLQKEDGEDADPKGSLDDNDDDDDSGNATRCQLFL